MKPLTGDEYNNIFHTTGIDIDGRRELLQNVLVNTIESSVRRFVIFVKSIPGFTQLPLPDQIALVKGIYYVLHARIADTVYSTNAANIIYQTIDQTIKLDSVESSVQHLVIFAMPLPDQIVLVKAIHCLMRHPPTNSSLLTLV